MSGKPLLHLKVTRGLSDPANYIGQIVEVPGIVVQAKSEAALVEEALDSLIFFMQTFPKGVFELVPSKLEVA